MQVSCCFGLQVAKSITVNVRSNVHASPSDGRIRESVRTGDDTLCNTLCYCLSCFALLTSRFGCGLQYPSGSWYFDEITRTATVVLRPVVSGSLSLSPRGNYTYVECLVSNKCLPYPVTTIPDTPRYLWCVVSFGSFGSAGVGLVCCLPPYRLPFPIPCGWAGHLPSPGLPWASSLQTLVAHL